MKTLDIKPKHYTTHYGQTITTTTERQKKCHHFKRGFKVVLDRVTKTIPIYISNFNIEENLFIAYYHVRAASLPLSTHAI